MPRLPHFTFSVKRLALILTVVGLLNWLIITVSATIGCFNPVFKTVLPFSVSATLTTAAPSFILSGDFNNDGRLDVVTATDTSGDGTWIRLSLGNGGFGPSMQIFGPATHLAAADFNNDNKLDLVMLRDTGSNNTASVYLGNGAGGFALSQNVGVFSRPQTVVTADFNADNKIDLATVNFNSNLIVVNLGDGTGHFGGPLTYATGAQPRGLAVGDFNNDGKPDLVTTTSSIDDGAIQVFLNTGSSFSGPISTTRPGGALYISVADLNNDNKADVVLSLYNGNSISVRLGNGAGGFNGFTGSNDYSIISQPANVNIADFNNDGKLDLATANRTVSNEISLLFGDGAGNFGGLKHLTVGPSPWSTAAGDFNNDGKPDLAVALRGNNSFAVLRGDGAGNFPELLPNFPVGATNPFAIAAGDFNSDGKNDLVTANQASNNISILTNDGRGTFGTPVNIAAGNMPSGVATGDVNNDGKTDIVVGSTGTGPNLYVLLGNGAGGFTQAPNGPYLVAGDPRTIAFGDLNGDNLPDIVTGAYNGDRISVLFNMGANGFGNYTEYVLSATVFYQVTGLVVGDFNQDNLPDVAAAASASTGGTSAIFVYFNLGGGALGNRAVYNPSGGSLIAADFNRDGKLDLVSGGSILLATGGGNFTAPASSGGFGSITADFNCDSLLDLAVILAPDQINLYKGDGFGHFTSAGTFKVSTSPTSLVAADLNDDRKPDIGIAVSSQFINAVTRLLNVCNKTPADFDDDGRTDISVWNPNNGNWYIFNSRDNSFRTQTDWGRQALGDIPVPSDYDGDAKQDIAIFRPSEGNWYIINSGFPSIRLQNWGGPGDRPVAADFDGDGKTDFAVFRPTEGNWYILFSANGTTRVQGWGISTDKLVPGDYDGDGRADIAVWRESEGNWYVLKSNGGVILQQWGASGDVPVPGDYDGDSRTDLAIFRPSEGNWYVLRSTNNSVLLRNWGAMGDVPIPGDYDRDGKTDVAIYRPSEGNWYIIQSSTNTAYIRNLGVGNEVPIPSTYIPYP